MLALSRRILPEEFLFYSLRRRAHEQGGGGHDVIKEIKTLLALHRELQFMLDKEEKLPLRLIKHSERTLSAVFALLPYKIGKSDLKVSSRFSDMHFFFFFFCNRCFLRIQRD